MKTIKIVVMVILLVPAVLFLDACGGRYIRDIKMEQIGSDYVNLRSVVAEAYIKTKTDPDFVNTAMEDQPMEVPEKYYTYIESAQGHGRLHVVAYADGDVSAYFGTPEKTPHYYLYGKGSDVEPAEFPFIINALRQNPSVLTENPSLIFFLCSMTVAAVGVVVFCIVRRVKKKNFEATIAALQADTEVDELP